jgi:hypothetical protein
VTMTSLVAVWEAGPHGCAWVQSCTKEPTHASWRQECARVWEVRATEAVSLHRQELWLSPPAQVGAIQERVRAWEKN